MPLVVIALGQALMSFNIAAMPVSMSGIVASFDTPATTVGTAIVMYSLGVSGFILLGAKLGQRFGCRNEFQAAVLALGIAMLAMAVSPSATGMVAAQALAGLAAAALVPTLVVLIASHYHGAQQAEALGWLGSAGALAGVLALVIGGAVATFATWRLTYGPLAGAAVVVAVLGFRLRPVPGNPDVRIDLVGVVLAATSIILIAVGFDHLHDWGVLLAKPSAPFVLLGVSPAPALIVLGVALGPAFFLWTQRRSATSQTPLLALRVIASPREWAAVFALFIVGVLEGALNFAVPLYMQIVQGRTSLETAVAMLPLMLAVVVAAILVVRLLQRFSPRHIARLAFVLLIAGTTWLALVARNDWSTLPAVSGLALIGLGQGALMTLLLNVLVTAAGKELAGDVGALRGVTLNLAGAVGTAVMGALLVGLLSALVTGQLAENPVIPPQYQQSELAAEFDLDNINFITNEQLAERLSSVAASPAQVSEAVRINTESRLQSLKIGFLALAGLALLAIFPCSWLPDYKVGELPDVSTSQNSQARQ